MPNVNDSEPKSTHKILIDFAAGLFTGAFCSGLFNPWDRALYLLADHNRKFPNEQRSFYHGKISERLIMVFHKQ